MEKGIFIQDIQPGLQLKGLFCVSSKSLRRTRNGSPFLSMTLSDRTGEIEARIWDNAQELDSRFDKGDILLVWAEGVEFNNQCQLKVNKLEVIPKDTIDPGHFLPSSQRDLEAAWKQCLRAVSSIKDPTLRKLIQEVFADSDICRDFQQAPAAKRMHHAYIGGLLEHVSNLLDLTNLICKKYPHLKKDLLIAACILHDLGKIRELKWQSPPIDYSDEGRLLGHINIAMEIIGRACQTLGLHNDHPSILAIKHIILSHHGQLEFGSPVLPMMEEAMIFHMIDDMDAKLNFLYGLKKTPDQENQGYNWSEYQRIFERYFYLPPLPEEEPMEAKEDNEAHKGQGPQQSLLWKLNES